MVAILLTPGITFAAVTDLKSLIYLAINYLGLVIPFIVSLSMVVFLWGIYRYFFKVDTDKGEAGQLILWGVVGFFVMISFWGLVNILVRTFDLNTSIPGIPTIQAPGGSSGANEVHFTTGSSNSGGFTTGSTNSGGFTTGSSNGFQNSGGSNGADIPAEPAPQHVNVPNGNSVGQDVPANPQ